MPYGGLCPNVGRVEDSQESMRAYSVTVNRLLEIIPERHSVGQIRGAMTQPAAPATNRRVPQPVPPARLPRGPAFETWNTF
jgi:hypothetical protein